MVEWSQLPDDLLSLIALKLHFLPDFQAFSLVCVRWRSATTPRCQRLHLQVPLIVLRPKDYSGTFELYSISNHEKVQFQLPELEIRCSRQFSQGWLATECHDEDIYLVNPYTRAKIPLFTQALGVKKHYLHGAKLSCNPTQQECVIIGVFSNMPLCFRRIGDEKWNFLPLKDEYDDAIYYNNMIYVVTCDPHANYLIIWRYLGKEEKEWCIPHVPHLPPKNSAYLFRSSLSNHLFCVVRHCHGGCTADCNVTAFYVMRLDENKQEWIHVDSLDGEALFIGYKNVVSAPACQILASTIKGDCIYFLGKRMMDNGFHAGFVSTFCMKSKQIEEIFTDQDPFYAVEWFQQVGDV
ncbi:F-box domain-containing protein [Dioscorea alata]|uniref:F-box domain-containing protein n=1 Tax=Dioscorea alata TaxID=55571 RepID=A0ACB7UM60_DIOAL|nr:F-box domain-containing protein [Dioscorea alata]